MSDIWHPGIQSLCQMAAFVSLTCYPQIILSYRISIRFQFKLCEGHSRHVLFFF